MLNTLFRSKSYYTGTVTQYHYQTDISDKGWHFVTLQLEDGTEIEAKLQEDSYKPFEVGQKISGKAISFETVPDGGETSISLIDIENAEGSAMLRTIKRPMRWLFEELAISESPHADDGFHLFGKLAHRFGSTEYTKNGHWIRPDPNSERAHFSETWHAESPEATAHYAAERERLRSDPIPGTNANITYKTDAFYDRCHEIASRYLDMNNRDQLAGMFRARRTGELPAIYADNAEDHYRQYERQIREWAEQFKPNAPEPMSA